MATLEIEHPDFADDRPISELVATLADDDEARAVLAERTLIRRGSLGVPALIEAVASAIPTVRFRAVYALGEIGDARAYDSVLAAATDEDPRVAHEAVAALRLLTGASEMATPLLDLIEEARREARSTSAGIVSQP